ncbi:MAG: preprotein translocase subunit SecY [Bacteroidales bacterium]|nr:preprotein translocase subunit SecY [Bacteroidales bacterium]
MKKLITTLKNIWAIEDLRKRILYTLGLVLVYRIGSYVVLPGVDPSQLTGLQNQTRDGILGLLNMFSGGAFSHASIFALGIMPYITASIVIQLFVMVIPYFQKMQREGESGRRKMNQITRVLTIAITVVQAPAYITNMIYQLGATPTAIYPFDGSSPGFFFWLSCIIILTSGTLFVMWLGERITDKGVGNGISLLIMVGIIARLPFALFGEFASRMEEAGGGLVMFIIELVVLLVVILLCILLVQGTRRVPVQYAKRIVGNKQYGGVRQYIPLKVNAAGVMPIIFAQAIMFIPITVMGFNHSDSAILTAFSDFNGFWYNLVFGLMIIAFTYFYTAISINPNQMAEDMKKNGGFIPGVKPGKKTAEYIEGILSKITFPGSIFLAIVAVLPAIVSLMGVNSQFAQFYGGTSLLIMVGVILDTLQQIESHLLMRHYDGLTKTGRIKGRNSMSISA